MITYSSHVNLLYRFYYSKHTSIGVIAMTALSSLGLSLWHHPVRRGLSISVLPILGAFKKAVILSLRYNDVIMTALASQITSLTIVYSTVYSRRRSNKTSKLRVTGLCAGNSPVTSEFPTQRASNAENVSIWWRHHVELRYRTDGIYMCICIYVFMCVCVMCHTPLPYFLIV